MSIAELLAGHRVVVCTGTGGVGKTTIAAVLGVEAAHTGRRVAVVTIDPARRLADALGLDGLTNDPQRIDGAWSGELWASMLDTKSTFDDLVARHARDADQAERILTNRFYQNVSSTLSGTQEYMAMEKLLELHVDERFDLVVVDTPPTRNALAFLDAPRLLTRLLQNRLYRTLMAPTRGVVRAVSGATQAFVRQLGRIVGAGVVDDVIGFFRAFEGMEEGFTARADQTMALLRSADTAFVLVASPRLDTVEEARWFAAQLVENDIAVDAIVVNRMHPRVDPAGVDRDDPAFAAFLPALDDLVAAATIEDDHVASLAELAPAATVARLPMLVDDIHDLDGLDALRTLLVEPS